MAAAACQRGRQQQQRVAVAATQVVLAVVTARDGTDTLVRIMCIDTQRTMSTGGGTPASGTRG